jgi:hypothetical protein
MYFPGLHHVNDRNSDDYCLKYSATFGQYGHEIHKNYINESEVKEVRLKCAIIQLYERM